MSAHEPMGVAVVGCGRIAEHYGKSLCTKPDKVRLVGGYDVIPERAQEYVAEHGGKAYDSYDALLSDDEVQIVLNLTIPVDFVQLVVETDIHWRVLQFDDACFVGSESVSSVDERHLAGPVLQIQRPIHCRVTSTDDENALVEQGRFFLDEIKDAATLKLLDRFIAQSVGDKGANAGRDQQGARIVYLFISPQDHELSFTRLTKV